MAKARRNETAKNIFADVASEALLEVENKEPLCLTELRAASEHEFRYSIIEKVDEGGMKTVYKAVDIKTRREVALAYIRSTNITEKNIRYFIQESWITAKLEHPNIVPIYDIGISPEGSPYFAMKLLSGENLNAILSRLADNDLRYTSKYTERYLLGVFVKICDAISYAHQCGVVHLDLKPANIQISDFGQVLVLDWGIANIVQLDTDDTSVDILTLDRGEYTHFGAVKGTPGFVAPELFKDLHDDPDHKADIFGLGAILYSMLAHQQPKPIQTETLSTVDAALIDIESGLERLDSIPSPLQSIIKKAMATQPDQRYTNVEELKTDVESFLTGHATLAEEAGFLRMQMLLIRRHVPFFATLSISLTLIMILTVTFVLRLSKSEEEAKENARSAVRNAAIALKNEKKARENEQRALIQEKAAQKSEKIAKQLIKKYEAEHELRKNREKTSVQHYIFRAQEAFGRCEPRKTLSNIEEVLTLSPKIGWIKSLKLHALLAMNDFDTILNEMPIFSNSPHFSIAKQFSEISKDEEKWHAHFNSFYKETQNVKVGRRYDFYSNIFYNLNKGKSFVEHQSLLEKIFKEFYPKSRLTYDSELDRVKISSRKIISTTAIVGLKFKQLDLSKVKILSCDFLWRHKNLEYLNLSRSQITTLTAFRELPNLTYLNVEGTPMPYLEKPRKGMNMKYLNIAHTSIRDYFWDRIFIKSINIIGAENFNLAGLFQSHNCPQNILLTKRQLKQLESGNDYEKRDDVKFFVYKRSKDVNEADFY